MGLVSPGDVHASEQHLYALLKLCKLQKFTRVVVMRFWMDVTRFLTAALDSSRNLRQRCLSLVRKDRDAVWEILCNGSRQPVDRIQLAYEAIVDGKANRRVIAVQAIKDSYARSVLMRSLSPRSSQNREPVAIVQNRDACIFFNFRPDRARELTKAFVLPTFDKFPRPLLKDLTFVTMMEYGEGPSGNGCVSSADH